MAGDLWLLESENLPKDYFQTMLDAIGKTTPEDCQDLAEEAIDPDKLVIVVVGDAKELEEDLKKIAPVTVVELP